jgi:DNA-binding PadR family transcriptional regulator
MSIAEGACLACIELGCEHGWSVASELAGDADLGRIFAVSRPLTYKTLDRLVGAGFLERAGTEPGGGNDRNLLRISSEGQRRLDEWLAAPAAHVRDVRTELLVKLRLLERLDRPRAALVDAQRAVLAPIAQAVEAESVEAGSDDVVSLWRSESSAAAARFLDRLA